MSLDVEVSFYWISFEFCRDYPEFYKQVYGLLQPSIFYLKNREQFFNLLDLFLGSL